MIVKLEMRAGSKILVRFMSKNYKDTTFPNMWSVTKRGMG